jgi:hypothetical protein
MRVDNVRTNIVSGMPLNIGRSFGKTMASQRQRFHDTLRVGCSQRLKDDVVLDGVVELMLRRPDQLLGSMVEKLPFLVVLILIVEDDGVLKSLEELGGRASPVKYITVT